MKKITSNLKVNKTILILVFLFITIRSIGLGNDITNSDALRWHRRSENFLISLKTFDLKNTYQRYHPGVTLMWLNSVVKQAAFTSQSVYKDSPDTTENSEWYPVIHGLSKFINILLYSVLFLFQIILINKLFGQKTGVIYGALMVFEPYLIGINRWFHLTSFEVFFSFTSFLVLMLWVKENKKHLLVLSAALLGLGILSKMSVLIIGPLMGIIILHRSYRANDIKNVLIFPLIVILTFVLFFPAIWVDPVFVYQKLSSAVSGSVSGDIRDSMLSESIKPFYYFLILFLRMSPVVLITSIISLTKITKESLNKLFILGYLVSYLLFLTLSDQKIDRYSIAIFPPLLLLSALLVVRLDGRIKRSVLLLQVAVFLFASVNFHPVYSAFYNPLIGGTSTALKIGLYENSGEYFAQAAQYLRKKGRDIVVEIPNNIDSFKNYYNGKYYSEINNKIDYVVESRDIDRIKVDSSCNEIERTFGPRLGPEVVYIFKCVKER